MKKLFKLFSILVLFLASILVITSCTKNDDPNQNSGSGEGQTTDDSGSGSQTSGEGTENTGENTGEGTGTEGGNTGEGTTTHIDYAAQVTLDFTTSSLKQKVTVKSYIDGDTTHFYLSTKIDDSDVLKARYLAVNTPESTGKIEEYGKAASNFTKATLQSATDIYIESDDENWNVDSTGSRYLVWVWYRTSATEAYRNLNIELLQNGLAIASNSAQNRYGTVAVAAINQAKAEKLNVYSGEKDPLMYYGDAVELTLKELRTNIEAYNGVKVAFEANVIKDYSQTVYVEEYDPELDIYFGMAVYYGFGAAAQITEILNVGNRARIVGTVQYYENGGTYQVSGLQYRRMKPNDPSNVQLIGEAGSATPAQYKLTEASTLVNGKVKVEVGDELKEFAYGELTINSSISMNSLTVKSIYTTDNDDSSSKGAMTLTCEAQDGTTVTVRTVVLYDENGKLVTEDAYEGKVINVKGLIDYYSGSYQIKVFKVSDITFSE